MHSDEARGAAAAEPAIDVDRATHRAAGGTHRIRDHHHGIVDCAAELAAVEPHPGHLVLCVDHARHVQEVDAHVFRR
jgi:hypothetical protein